MADLVIVESPNKVKTIQSFLGKDYQVLACFGHISKLERIGPDNLGIDIKTWTPSIKLNPEKLKYFNRIKEAAKSSQRIFIATDADREGEAIGADIINFLKAEHRYSRVKYKEITKSAILAAFKNPTLLNNDLINSQKARRMLDRILGFLLSRLMREKLRNVTAWNLSAGRVQSIALKLVVDKERQRREFKPLLYSKIKAEIEQKRAEGSLFLELEKEGGKFQEKSWLTREQGELIFKELQGVSELVVEDISQAHQKRPLSNAFKQSSLFKNSGLSAQVTSQALQRLYEGYGDGGLISYPRTDATWLSTEFISKSQQFLAKHFDANLLADSFKEGEGDQDAHEAIRPTSIKLTPVQAASKYPLSRSEFHIYKLIYEQTIKVLLKPPIFLQTTYTLTAKEHRFFLIQNELIFEGYLALIKKETKQFSSKSYQLGERVRVKLFHKEDKQTSPPTRYTEGRLIAKLDKIKVGRPSTFAPTVKKIKQRNYVEVVDGTLVPTPIGEGVMEKLYQGFKNEINESYTAQVEEQLDLISEGRSTLSEVMDPFWEKFQQALSSAKESLTVSEVRYQEVEGLVCPIDSSKLVYKFRKDLTGKFIACSNFPKCRFAATKIEEVIDWKPKEQVSFKQKLEQNSGKAKIDKKCSKCGAKMALRNSARGEFFGCSNFPKCRFIENLATKSD